MDFYPFAMVLLGSLVQVRLYCCLALFLCLALAGIPAMAMPANPASAPLGMVMQAERAHLGVDITSGGATIYDGDRLETQDDGTLRARLGGSQLYLRQGTITEVHGLTNGYSASLLHGTVIASSPEGQTFELLADGATIRPVGAQATVARVTWLTPYALVIAANVGAVKVSLDGELKTIEAGNSYRMVILPDSADPQNAGGKPPTHGGRNKAIFVWIAIAGAVTGIIAWRAIVSPSGL